MHVLVLRPGALGDTLLAVPALRAVRAVLPEARLQLAAHGAAARLLQTCGEVHEGVVFDDERLGWLFGVGAPSHLPGLVVAWLEDRDQSLRRRLDAFGIRAIQSPSRPTDGSGVHCARHLWESLRPLGPLVWHDDTLRVQPTATGEVLVHPGSGAARKNWPPERFAAVIRLLCDAGARVRLVVGEADERAADSVEQAFGAALPRLQTSSLAALASTLAGCEAYLGNDSGVSHLAGLVGAPSTVLFGPTPWQTWRPLGPHVGVLPFEASPPAVANAILGDRRSARRAGERPSVASHD